MAKKKPVTPWLSQFISQNTELETKRRMSEDNRRSYEFARGNEAYANSLISDWRQENQDFYNRRAEAEQGYEDQQTAKKIADAVVENNGPIAAGLKLIGVDDFARLDSFLDAEYEPISTYVLSKYDIMSWLTNFENR